MKDIYKELKKLIYSAEVGDRLPSELLLAHRYGVSRSTLRKAINQLRIESLLDSRQGAGHFVKNRAVVPPYTLYRETDTAKFTIKILNFAMITAPLSIIDKLNMASQQKVYSIRRLFIEGSKPVKLQDSFIPVSLFPELTYTDLQQEYLLKKSFYAQQLMAHVQFMPCLADSEQAELLAVKRGELLQQMVALTMIAPSIQESGKEYYLEYSITTFHHDLERFSLLLD